MRRQVCSSFQPWATVFTRLQRPGLLDSLHTHAHEYCHVRATQSEAISIRHPFHNLANESKIHLTVKQSKHLWCEDYQLQPLFE